MFILWQIEYKYTTPPKQLTPIGIKSYSVVYKRKLEGWNLREAGLAMPLSKSSSGLKVTSKKFLTNSLNYFRIYNYGNNRHHTYMVSTHPSNGWGVEEPKCSCGSKEGDNRWIHSSCKDRGRIQRGGKEQWII